MNIHKHDSSKRKDDSLPEELSDDLENYRQSENSKISLTEFEVESALDNVLLQIGDKSENSSEGSGNGFSIDWKLMSIAASVTFIGMLFFLSIPVTVEVPNSELATVNLPDGSSITLNSGSELSYSRLYNHLNRTVTLSGEGYFDVQSNADKPFIVNTPNSSVKVLGTEFNLSDWDDSSQTRVKLSVTEGTVEFAEINDNDSMVLNENESAVLNSESEITPYSADINNMIAWLSNNISFQNDDLQHAFGMLERRFDTVISIDKKLNLQSESITAYYHDPKGVESIIQDICTIKGLSYQKTSNGYRISTN